VLAQTLYDRIRIEVERKVGESGGVLRGLDAGGEAWLTEVERTWQSFREKMVGPTIRVCVFLSQVSTTALMHCRRLSLQLMVRSIFLHLDRTYVLQNAQLLSLWWGYAESQRSRYTA
jgi:cullin-4